MVGNGKALPRSCNRKEGAEDRGSPGRVCGRWLDAWPLSARGLEQHAPVLGPCSFGAWRGRPRCRSGPVLGQARARYSLAPCAFVSDPRRSWAQHLFGICSVSGPVRFRCYFGFGVHSVPGAPTPRGRWNDPYRGQVIQGSSSPEKIFTQIWKSKFV